MIHDLQSYMTRFAGYGALRAPIWFVGLEEGGGRDVTELRTRVETWARRGSEPLEDLASYHRAIGFSRHFDPPYPLQRTWAPLVRILQAWRGAATDVATLRQVQATELGAHGGAASLLELLPLPASGVNAWPYASLASDIPALADRARYRSTYEPARITMLRGLIETGAPQVVVCYGLSYRAAWQSLAGVPLHPLPVLDRTCFAGSGATRQLIAVPHPVAHGNSSRFWEKLGEMLRELAEDWSGRSSPI
jgi:hypothetical protein